jgi:hypothetical protein
MSRVKHDDEADPAGFARGVLGRDVPLLAGVAEPSEVVVALKQRDGHHYDSGPKLRQGYGRGQV